MHGRTNILLSDIEDCLAQKGWRSRFKPKLEQVYRADISSVRQIVAQRVLIPTLVVYNLLLLTDFLLLPKTAGIASLLHFGVVTPAILLAFYLHARVEDYYGRQVLEATVPLFISGQVLAVMALNDSPNVGLYQFFIALIIQFSSVNQRLEMRVANAVALTIFAAYAVVLWFQALTFEAKFIGLVCTAVSSYLGLQSNMRSQRDARYGYLMRLREQVRLHVAEDTAMRDPLTGLRNRRYLERFTEGLPMAGAHVLSLILIDIDFFKPYNDLHGHARGDTCLRSVAQAIDRSLANSDGVAVRYGGEEFLVLLPGMDGAQALDYAEAIRLGVESLMIEHGMSAAGPQVTISAGVACGDVARETLERLINAADAALYLAKAQGRNRVQCICDGDTSNESRTFASAEAAGKRG